MDLMPVPRTVELMGPAAGPERPRLAVAHHSENTNDLTALQDAPVKGMGF